MLTAARSDVPRVKQPAVAIERVASTLPDVEDDEYLDKEPAVLALWNNERAGFMILPELEPDGEVEARLVQTAQFICAFLHTWDFSRS